VIGGDRVDRAVAQAGAERNRRQLALATAGFILNTGSKSAHAASVEHEVLRCAFGGDAHAVGLGRAQPSSTVCALETCST
jgi:hypothetical protein